jgi:small subunit ribosomal protein S21
MARRPTPRRAEEFVFFDVLYEDGMQTSNRKVPSSELNDLDGDLLAKPYLEAQDRKIAEMSGKPRGPIKSVARASRR